MKQNLFNLKIYSLQNFQAIRYLKLSELQILRVEIARVEYHNTVQLKGNNTSTRELRSSNESSVKLCRVNLQVHLYINNFNNFIMQYSAIVHDTAG